MFRFEEMSFQLHGSKDRAGGDFDLQPVADESSAVFIDEGLYLASVKMGMEKAWEEGPLIVDEACSRAKLVR